MSKSHGWTDGGAWDGIPGTVSRIYRKGDCGVIISREDRHGDGRLWDHLSISCADRYPTWDEIKDARYALLSLGRWYAQLLPPPQHYLNLHPNCFHLWEIDDPKVGG